MMTPKIRQDGKRQGTIQTRLYASILKSGNWKFEFLHEKENGDHLIIHQQQETIKH